MTPARRDFPDDPYAALRMLLREQMTPADRRDFDAFIASLTGDAATTTKKEPKACPPQV